MKQRKLTIATVLFSVAVLTACGGGGGGGGETPADVTGALTIEGTAIKGPMSKAKISVHKTNADGNQGDLLKEVTSEENGKYKLTVNGYSGVVLLVVGVTDQTKMYDEETKTEIKPTVGFRMRASFAAESGKSYSAEINPYTELATVAALAKAGGLSSVNVEQSNKDMTETLSFNPLTTTAEFDPITKDPKNEAALALASVSRMAHLGDLGCSSGDQATKVVCVIGKMSEKGMGNVAMKLALETRSNEIADVRGMNRMIFGVPSGTPATAATPRELTKAFIGALHSNAKALQADDLTLQTELEAVANDINGRTSAITSSNLNALNVTLKGVQLWNDFKNPNALFVQQKDFFMGHEYLGDCSFYSDSNYSVAAKTTADANFVDCGTAPQYIPVTDSNGESCKAVGELCSTVWTVRVRLQPDAKNRDLFTVYTQTRKAQSTFTSRTYRYSVPGKTIDSPSCPTGVSCIPFVVQFEDSRTRTHFGAAFPGNVARLTTNRGLNGKVTDVNLAGYLSPAFHVDQNPNVNRFSLRWVDKPSEQAQVFGDTQKVNLTAVLSTVLSSEGVLDKLAVSGSIVVLLKNDVPETVITLSEGSYLQAKPDVTGSKNAGSEEKLFKLVAVTAGDTISGDLKIGAFKFDASRRSYIPTEISFGGSLQRSGAGFFEGTLKGEALNHASFDMQMPPSSSNFQTKRVSFKGDVTIPNRPVLKVSLSATRKDTGSSANDTTLLGGQYVQGGITMNVSGSSSATFNIVTLESTDGIKLVIDKSKTSYPLTKGGESMSVYSATDKKLTYADQSSEQF